MGTFVLIPWREGGREEDREGRGGKEAVVVEIRVGEGEGEGEMLG